MVSAGDRISAARRGSVHAVRRMAGSANHVRVVHRSHSCFHRETGTRAGANDRRQTIICLEHFVSATREGSTRDYFGLVCVEGKIIPDTEGAEISLRPNRVIVCVVARSAPIVAQQGGNWLRAVAGRQKSGGLLERLVGHHCALGHISVMTAQAHNDAGLNAWSGFQFCEFNREFAAGAGGDAAEANYRPEVLSPQGFIARITNGGHAVKRLTGGIPLQRAAIAAGSAVRGMAADATAPAVLMSTQFIDACDAGTLCICLCHCHTGTNQHGESKHHNFLHELKPPDKGFNLN